VHNNARRYLCTYNTRGTMRDGLKDETVDSIDLGIGIIIGTRVSNFGTRFISFGRRCLVVVVLYRYLHYYIGVAWCVCV